MSEAQLSVVVQGAVLCSRWPMMFPKKGQPVGRHAAYLECQAARRRRPMSRYSSPTNGGKRIKPTVHKVFSAKLKRVELRISYIAVTTNNTSATSAMVSQVSAAAEWVILKYPPRIDSAVLSR